MNKADNNPILISSDKIKALDDAYVELIGLIEELSKNDEEGKAALDNIKIVLGEAYVKKRTSYFLEEKTKPFVDYFNRLLNLTFDQQSKREDILDLSSKTFYLRRTQRFSIYE